MSVSESFRSRDFGQATQGVPIQDPVPLRRSLNFIVATHFPFRGMADDSGPYHVQIDIDEATDQVSIRGDGCGEIAIFPECAPSGFSLIEFLCDPSSYQLHTFRNTAVTLVMNKKVNVIRGDDVVQNRKAIAFSGFEQPMPPPQSIPLEPEEKFPIMATMREVPHVAG